MATWKPWTDSYSGCTGLVMGREGERGRGYRGAFCSGCLSAISLSQVIAGQEMSGGNEANNQSVCTSMCATYIRTVCLSSCPWEW